jgi:hypothetical protein
MIFFDVLLFLSILFLVRSRLDHLVSLGVVVEGDLLLLVRHLPLAFGVHLFRRLDPMEEPTLISIESI